MFLKVVATRNAATFCNLFETFLQSIAKNFRQFCYARYCGGKISLYFCARKNNYEA